MKHIIFFFCLLTAGCGPYIPANPTREGDNTVMIRVDCKNELPVISSVMDILRFVRYSDVEKTEAGTSMIIKVRYKNLTESTAFKIHENLRLTAGVLDIQINKDGVPVKNDL